MCAAIAISDSSLSFSLSLSLSLSRAVLSQLQQELNYRFLQDRSSGVFIAHPNQVDQAHQSQQQQQVHGFRLHRSSARGGDGSQPMETNTSLSLPSSSTGAAVAATSGGGSRGLSEQPGFKWCYAHVAIAKQIQKQQHQELRANVSSSFLKVCFLSLSFFLCVCVCVCESQRLLGYFLVLHVLLIQSACLIYWVTVALKMCTLSRFCGCRIKSGTYH